MHKILQTLAPLSDIISVHENKTANKLPSKAENLLQQLNQQQMFEFAPIYVVH